jgi:hypothetical protein
MIHTGVQRPVMSIVLISTSNVSGGRSEALERLLTSVADTVARRPNLSIRLLLLLQNCPSDLASSRQFPAFVDVSSIPHLTPVSAARNSLLSRALSRGLIEPATIVGFPDDDCWYPPGALEYIADQFSRTAKLDLWLCRYSSNPFSATDTGMTCKPAKVSTVIREASANTIFVSGRLIRTGISFDEELGLGTLIGGEDTEFALRGHILSAQTMYLDSAVIGHRDKNPQLRAKYYRGGLVAIARHAQQQGDIVIELLRKIAVGGWLIARGELSLANFFRALSAAFNAWRTNPRMTCRRN